VLEAFNPGVGEMLAKLRLKPCDAIWRDAELRLQRTVHLGHDRL